MKRFSEKLRYGSLGALLVLTLIAAAVPDEHNGDDRIVEAVAWPQGQPAADKDSARKDSPRLALDKLNRQKPQDPLKNLFTSKSWYVPPPAPRAAAPVAPPPPPPPAAPPLPFFYMGKLLEGVPERYIVFLVKGDKLYAVAEGDVIDNTYRVEGISSGQLGLTYLPLNIRQFIAIGSGS
jgi:hypothetical protein